MASRKLKLGDIVFCEWRSGLLGRNLYQQLWRICGLS